MGFWAPSAEDVYRRALRLDVPAGLTDRFGFSIVLVNDQSAVCRDFLERYCVDLCLRTADRIRFIFFSEMRTEDLREIAGVAEDRGESFLRRVLASFSGAPRFDHEEQPWSALRPEGFHPIRGEDDANRLIRVGRLDHDVDTRTAVPGVGMALAFAQRLGIGRHVPCVVAFTEIAAAKLHVLPIAALTADEVFAHIRFWIDDFYEVNRPLIDRWIAVEREIESVAWEGRESLKAIRAWRNRCLASWRDLQLLSEMIRRLEETGHPSPDLLSTIEGSAATKSLRAVVDQMNHQLADLALDRRPSAVAGGRRPLAIAVERARREADTASCPRDFAQAWRTMSRHFRATVSSDTFDMLRRLLEPWRGTAAAWREAVRGPLAPAAYGRELYAWAHHSTENRLTRREGRRVILDAIRSLSIAVDPVRGAETVFARMAEELGVDCSSDAYRTATAPLRPTVVGVLRSLLVTFPPWASAWSPELTVGESTPIATEPDMSSPGCEDPEGPFNRPPRTPSYRDERDYAEAVRLWRRNAIADLALAASRVSSEFAGALRDIREETLAQLQSLRPSLEAGAAAAADAAHGPSMAHLDANRVRRLHVALDEYDRVTSSIDFPHERDALVQQVALHMSVGEAVAAQLRARESSAVGN